MFVLSMSFIGPQIAELDMIHDPRSIDPLILPTRFPTDLVLLTTLQLHRSEPDQRKMRHVYANNAIEELEIKWQALTQKEKHFEAERFFI